jgi:hypothetical protein
MRRSQPEGRDPLGKQPCRVRADLREEKSSPAPRLAHALLLISSFIRHPCSRLNHHSIPLI